MRRYLYLCLGLACFFGFLAIFFVDGYMGIFDTLEVNSGRYPQRIEHYQWLRGGGTWSALVEWGEKGFFSYEVANRQFSSYTADIDVSLWQGGEKLRDLISQQISIGAFDKARLEWVLDTVELESYAPKKDSYYEYAVIMRWGEMERKLRLYIAP